MATQVIDDLKDVKKSLGSVSDIRTHADALRALLRDLGEPARTKIYEWFASQNETFAFLPIDRRMAKSIVFRKRGDEDTVYVECYVERAPQGFSRKPSYERFKKSFSLRELNAENVVH
jgi:hypothetical protein